MLSKIRSYTSRIPRNKWTYTIGGVAAVVATGVIGYHTVKTFSEFGEHSEGIVVGMLYNYALSGPFIFTTGEGEIHMGRDSTPWIDKGIQRNPFHFSSTESTLHRYADLQGQTVVAHYLTRQWNFNNLNGDTNVRVWQIEPVKPNPSLKICGVVDHSSFDNIINSKSSNPAGRITDVHEEGFWHVGPSTYEITVQLSDAGNKFMDLSITDSDIFECAKEFAATGQMVRIGYVKPPIGSIWRNTDYRVTGIEVVPTGH
jgi:hypothetical protein